MNGRRLLRRCARIAALGSILPLAVWAQFIPTEPVTDLRLPMFNDEGFLAWEVRGSEGRYIDENRIEITALELRVFSGDEAGALEIEITSPKAVVHPADRLVSGPGVLRVVGPGYDLFGEDWTYNDRSKSVIVRRSVIVTLSSEIGSILK